MRFLILVTAIAFSAAAQNVNVKDIKADEPTTIEIRKGDKAIKTELLWEVVEGNADITGDHTSARKDARVEWKKACDSWKKEFRDDNKENRILSLNCGSPSCIAETEGTLCKSQGAYKIKTRLN